MKRAKAYLFGCKHLPILPPNHITEKTIEQRKGSLLLCLILGHGWAEEPYTIDTKIQVGNTTCLKCQQPIIVENLKGEWLASNQISLPIRIWKSSQRKNATRIIAAGSIIYIFGSGAIFGTMFVYKGMRNLYAKITSNKD